MNKFTFAIKLASVLAVFFVMLFPLNAVENYYVSPNGTGNGAAASTPASLTSLNTKLGAIVTADDRTLNVYFIEGVYQVPAGGLNFRSTTSSFYIAGMNVTFLPYDSEAGDVILEGYPTVGATTSKFVTLPTGTSSNNMTLTIREFIFRNFSSTGLGSDITGDKSLFTVGAYHTLNLEGVSAYRIYSNRNPLMTVAANATFNAKDGEFSEIEKLSAYNADYPIFDTGGANGTITFDNCLLDNWKGGTLQSDYNNMFYIESAGTVFSLTDCVISNSTTNGSLIRSAGSSTVTVSGCTFTENTFTASNRAIMYFTLGSATVSGCTFYRNTASRVFLWAGGTLMAYNNTVSSNTSSYSFRLEAGSTTLLNNTVFYSGDVYLSSSPSSSAVRNNLVVGNKINPVTTALGNICSFNISDGRYYEGSIPIGGTTGGSLIANFNNYFDSELTEYEAGRPPVHELLNVSASGHPILKHGSSAGYELQLATDQKGNPRPTVVPISVGSVDLVNYEISNRFVSYLYDPQVGLIGSQPIDITSSIIAFPPGLDLSNSTITITIGSGAAGTLTQDPVVSTTFIFEPNRDPNDNTRPATGAVNSPTDFEFEISGTDSNGNVLSNRGIITVRIFNIRTPLGMIDDDAVRCHAEMGTVDFSASTNLISNTTANRNASFTIPLVGDLNSDGKPEIVLLRSNSSVDPVSLTIYGFLIYNGQDNSLISAIDFPEGFTFNGNQNGWHISPSHMVLIDADRNGQAEIVVATNTTSNSTYTKRLISYEVSSDLMSVTQKWISAPFFSGPTDMFERPIPQVMDMDADNIPEILVYNKIYNALDGSLRFTLENTESTLAVYNATVPANLNSLAFTGRDRYERNVSSGDNHMQFNYMYDIDFDGKMEVIAGGKVYYKINYDGQYTNDYEVLSVYPTFGIGDGKTGVADINGDGKPEIVVLRTDPTSRNRAILDVWDPDLVVEDVAGSGVWRTRTDADGAAVPVHLSQRIIPFNYILDYGTHSYIYIGDVDGRETNINGTMKRLPEISILGARFYHSLLGVQVPVYPGITMSNLNNGYPLYSNSAHGSLLSFTWDPSAATDRDASLKVSFLMEHDDQSYNTGFTLFDFNNSGKQNIVYRDERHLRIIDVGAVLNDPYLPWTGGRSAADVLYENVTSATGFEYPVIADLDDDASSDVAVTSGAAGSTYYGTFAVVKSNSVKFAPAPKVWNQFMYSPLRVNENLTTPYVNLHPLDTAFSFKMNEADNAKVDIYNNTITQVPLFSVNRDAGTFSPIVYLADGKIEEASLDGNIIRLKITNTGDASLTTLTPIAIYRNEVAEAGVNIGYVATYTLQDLGVTIPIYEGESADVEITVPAANENYVIRLSDDSNSSTGTWVWRYGYNDDPGTTLPAGMGVASSQFRDCNWNDNMAMVGNFMAIDDIYTVLQYEKVTLNVLDNDIFPETCDPELVAAEIITPEGLGVLSGAFGTLEVSADNKSLIYTAPRTYPNVVTIEYKLKCDDNEDTGHIYIFSVESCSDAFAVCYGSDYTVCLREEPEGTTFTWYNDINGTTEVPAPGTLTNVTSDLNFYVRPVLTAPYDNITFPVKEVTIKTVSDGTSSEEMTWTGAYSSEWNDPQNWLVKSGTDYIETNYAPSVCTNVIIPTGLERYPKVGTSGSADTIHVEDRAMLANTHNLTYSSATVKVNFGSSERDRWVMYSAPLRKTYTGDYMLVDYTDPADPKPIHKAVYMTFFQSENPDEAESVARENAFTRTFGSVATLLPLGKPFNVWIDTDVDATTPFVFPSPFEKYEYYVHGVWSDDPPAGSGVWSPELDRTDENGIKVSGRFIVEDIPSEELDSEGGFTLTAVDDKPEFDIVMMSNPFMAYLDMEKFLLENINMLEPGYKIWTGIDDAFISFHYNETSWYDRLWVVDDPSLITESASPRYVAPLQSFMVMKKNSGATAALKFNPVTMTLTTRPEDVSGDYELRNAVYKGDPAGLLRITATQVNTASSTVLINAPKAPNTFGREDSRKVFYDFELSGYSPDEVGNALSLYTISSDNIALSINMMGNYEVDVPLGLRLHNEGEISFNFTGMENFGQQLYLKDGNKYIDLSAIPQYSAQVFRKESDKGLIYEINDRFVLTTKNGTGIEGEQSQGGYVAMTSDNGELKIFSDREMKSVTIFSLTGSMLNKIDRASAEYRIQGLTKGEVYVVRVMTADGPENRKVIIK